MYPKFTFIRHGESLHNEKTKEIVNKLPPTIFYKDSKEYQNMKHSQELLDAPMTKLGKKQVEQARKTIKLEEIDTVVVSPLRRALESCDIIFGKQENVRIYVEPLLCEWMFSACDIGSKIEESREMFGKFDFEKISEINQDLWYLNILPEKVKGQILERASQREKEQMEAKNNKIIHRISLEFMKQNGSLETLNDIKERGLKLKKQLAFYKRNSSKKVAIVAHGGIIRTLTATGFHENGEPINSAQFNNAGVKQIPIIIEGECFQQDTSVPFCQL